VWWRNVDGQKIKIHNNLDLCRIGTNIYINIYVCSQKPNAHPGVSQCLSIHVRCAKYESVTFCWVFLLLVLLLLFCLFLFIACFLETFLSLRTISNALSVRRPRQYSVCVCVCVCVGPQTTHTRECLWRVWYSWRREPQWIWLLLLCYSSMCFNKGFMFLNA